MQIRRAYSDQVAPGKPVTVSGWVDHVRDLGGLKFFLLRDRSGKVQVTIKKGLVADGIADTITKLNREDCVTVQGKAKKSPQAPGGIEIIPEKINIVNKSATPLPLDIGTSGKDKRFDYRWLDMRDPKLQTIFKIKDIVFNLTRQYYTSEGFTEVFTPIVQAAGAEGGSSMFPVIYYQKEAFLRQSPQLYKQMLMTAGFDRVFEIGAAFRAEEFHTRKHLCEFQSVDAEMSFIESEEDVMGILEGCVHYIFKGLAQKYSKLLKELGVEIKVPEIPFKRFTYDEVIKLIKGKAEVKWGDDLGDSEERILGEILAKKGIEWYFITKYPSQIKPFYIMMDGKYSRGFDLGYRGMEMSSGGQREHRHDVLVKVIKSKGLDPANFEFYLEPFRYGCPSHGGFGLGIERVIQQMLNLPDIKETIMFPRTPERLVP